MNEKTPLASDDDQTTKGVFYFLLRCEVHCGAACSISITRLNELLRFRYQT